MRIFLDDLRPAPEGWELVTNVYDLMMTLLLDRMDEPLQVVAISLDNDLIEGMPEGVDFVQAFMAMKLWVPTIYLHTANPTARAYMLGYLESYNERVWPDKPIKIHNCPPPGYLENVEDGWYEAQDW